MQIFESQFNESVLFPRVARGQMITWRLQIDNSEFSHHSDWHLIQIVNYPNAAYDLQICENILLHQRWLTPPTYVL